MLISEFYNNRDILITGGSGFIGKAFIEKVLRSCPGVRNIFVLLRPKKNKSFQERSETLLKDSAFINLREKQPEVLQKIQPIQADCSEVQLDISAEDLKRLHNVSVIIHSAATVRFDEPLREAILLNTRSTLELLKIAETFDNVAAFLYISTTYSNPKESVVKEQVYEPMIDAYTAIKIAETLDDNLLNAFMPKISQDHVNSYTFTKNLSEYIVDSFKEKLPVAILRPSIVISSLNEPQPGWVDNVYGPLAMLLFGGAGLKHVEYSDPKTILAVVPCDIVVRSTIIAAYKLGTEDKNLIKTKPVEVYNCAVDSTAPLTIRSFLDLATKHNRTVPFEKTIWAPSGTIHSIRFLFILQVLLQQVPISIIFDFLLRLQGKKPMTLKIQRVMVSASKALYYFMFTTWQFRVEKFFELDKNVSPGEKDEFGFLKLCYFDYETFYPNIFYGLREFILKEPREPSSGARKRFKMLKALDIFIKFVLVLWLMRFIFQCFFL